VRRNDCPFGGNGEATNYRVRTPPARFQFSSDKDKRRGFRARLQPEGLEPGPDFDRCGQVPMLRLSGNINSSRVPLSAMRIAHCVCQVAYSNRLCRLRTSLSIALYLPSRELPIVVFSILPIPPLYASTTSDFIFITPH